MLTLSIIAVLKRWPTLSNPPACHLFGCAHIVDHLERQLDGRVELVERGLDNEADHVH